MFSAFSAFVKAPSPPAGATASQYKVGELVEYLSATTNSWITAKVQQINANGTINLDVKANVSADKIRKFSGRLSAAGPAGAAGTFAVNEMVEYFSASSGTWIPAKITKVYPQQGVYDLDCKANVTADKIRKKGGVPAPRGISAASSTASAPIKLNAPVQLLKVTRSGMRWRYEVCQEGAKVLESYGPRRIAVASVCGLYGTGKSYLLNLLLERIQKREAPFKVGSSTQACTDGLWLWGSAEQADSNSPLLAFLDCEGIGSGESDKTRDAQLMSLCGLISSVLLLNTKGALNERTLNSLALACKFGEQIDEHGNEASRPLLLWVIRDFVLEKDQSGRTMTPDQYLEQTLQSGPTDATGDRGSSALEVRKNLRDFFGRRSCTTLVQPVTDEKKLQNLTTAPYQSLRGEFRTGVEALRAQMNSALKSNPKAIGGQAISSFAFAALLRKFAEALNSSKTLHVKSAWNDVQHTNCGNLAEDIKGTAHKKMRDLATGQEPGGPQLPLSDETIRGLFLKNRQECRQTWDEKAVGDESVRNEYWREIEESLATEEGLVTQQNTRKADAQLNEAMRPWQEWLDSDNSPWEVGSQVTRDLGEMMDRMPSAPLSRAARASIEAAGRRVAAVRGAVASAMKEKIEAERKCAEMSDAAARNQQELTRARRDLETLAKKEEDLIRCTNELDDSKEQMRLLLNDVEDSKRKELDAKNKANKRKEGEESLERRIQQETLARERLSNQHSRDRAKLEEEIDREKFQKTKYMDELDQLKGELAKLEETRLKARSYDIDMQRIELELKEHRMRLDEKDRLLEERNRDHENRLREQESKERLHQRELELAKSEHRRLQEQLEEARAGFELEKDRYAGRYESRPASFGSDRDEDIHAVRAAHRQELERAQRAEARIAELELAEARAAELEQHLESGGATASTADREELERVRSAERKLHDRIAELERALEARPGTAAMASSSADDSRFVEAERLREIENELARARADHAAERATLEAKAEQIREEHKNVADEAYRRLQDERKVRETDARNAGKFEGQVRELNQQKQKLEERTKELEEQAHQVENLKGQIQGLQREKERLERELERAKAHNEALVKSKAEADKKRAERTDADDSPKQPKCGCSVS